MKYYSLNRQSPVVDFRQAAIAGQAPDKGLYFPEQLPQLPADLLRNLTQYSNEAIAYEVIKPFVGDSIDDAALKNIVAETVNFDIPLVPVNEDIASLELFHGPTLAFKDIGARFMSRCLGYFLQGSSQRVVVLVATSGDTGGAVANGFYNVPGVDVVVLYPSGKVSAVQEAQIAGLGNNIHALEVSGTFDDCQQMVKQAFADAELQQQLFLTSANSINVARWLPQQFYYFFALKQWQHEQPPVICVPSGNFGNICAGILAYKTGLPVQHFIAACNANDVVPAFMHTQSYAPQPAVATISNAMDVGNPSNFVRVLELFHQQFGSLADVFSSVSISDDVTKQTIGDVYRQYGYMLDPHGAVGYEALQQYLQQHTGQKGIVLETAHPVKFINVMQEVLHADVLKEKEATLLLNGSKQSVAIEADFAALKNFLKKV